MIAILTTDPILSRMLTLEAERGEFSLTTPENATLWLLDLDHPPRPLPKSTGAYVIGFTAEGESPLHRDCVLPLPYPTAELQHILKSYFTPHEDRVPRHLPGIAMVAGRRIALSPAEEKLFSLLLEHQGKTVPFKTLLAALPESHAKTNVLQVHMYRLRRKLSEGGVSYIRAVRGVGYRLA